MKPPPGVPADHHPHCCICDAVVTGMKFDRQIEEYRDLMPMWPNGPLVEDPGDYAVRQRIKPGSDVFTVYPCGHRIPAAQFSIVYRKAPQ